ncbi:hypothetical protein RFI_28246 [Reticulomyxa filosa]|uniref:Uncharacterized protein n=1 Tax=Reticulomyxa filosa TaxID=46433 RepID=X6M666_RETFI|nr:hypothetical protein RFI_28246 [Reticulomyxa filosa]|eukprot:ETO09141.1 hypothetical protein RFI_28246 [Reticulomyxa filosa]
MSLYRFSLTQNKTKQTKKKDKTTHVILTGTYVLKSNFTIQMKHVSLFNHSPGGQLRREMLSDIDKRQSAITNGRRAVNHPRSIQIAPENIRPLGCIHSSEGRTSLNSSTTTTKKTTFFFFFLNFKRGECVSETKQQTKMKDIEQKDYFALVTTLEQLKLALWS